MYKSFSQVSIGQRFIITEEASGTNATYEKVSDTTAILREIDQWPEEAEIETEFGANYEVEAIN